MDLEREIWGHAFKTILGLGRHGSGLSYNECGLCITEPLFNFPVLQAATEQVQLLRALTHTQTHTGTHSRARTHRHTPESTRG